MTATTEKPTLYKQDGQIIERRPQEYTTCISCGADAQITQHEFFTVKDCYEDRNVKVTTIYCPKCGKIINI